MESILDLLACLLPKIPEITGDLVFFFSVIYFSLLLFLLLVLLQILLCYLFSLA